MCNKKSINVLFIFLIGLLVFVNIGHAALYEEISALELKERVNDDSDNGYIILDMRESTEYDLGHIPESINIPLKVLGYRYIELDKTKDIIVYCNVGIESKIACQILINVGFKDVYNLTGGLKEWSYALVTGNGRVSL